MNAWRRLSAPDKAIAIVALLLVAAIGAAGALLERAAHEPPAALELKGSLR